MRYLAGCLIIVVFAAGAACRRAVAAGGVLPNQAQGVARGNHDVIRQRERNDCGLAAIATLAQAIGVHLDMSDLERENPIHGPGLTLLDLVRIARAHGIALRGVFARVPNGLTTPWIAHLRTQDGHYVVVEEALANGFIVGDPASGVKAVSVETFRTLWSGYGLVLGQ